MTSSRKYERLLQAGCLGLIGMLTAAGCGGSSSPNTRDGSTPDVVSGDVLPAGAAAVLTVSTPAIEFETVDLGTTSAPQKITVKNIGTAQSGPLTVSVTGAGLNVSGCNGQTLAINATCEISVTAKPAAIGPISGTVTVYDIPANTKSVNVSGYARAPGQFTLAPSPLDLGPVLQGKTATGTVTMTNTASAGLTGLSIGVSGTGFTRGTDTCTESLGVGMSCTIVVNFAASAAGPAKGTLTVVQSGQPVKTLAVTAMVQTLASLRMTPPSATFFATEGKESQPYTFYVTNTGDVDSAIPTVNLGGTNKDQFAVASSDCAAALPGGAKDKCQVVVVYKPAKGSTTNASATLTVAEPAGGSSASATLTGTPVPESTLTITGTPTDLGIVVVGGAGAASTFTVTNTGGEASGAVTVSASPGNFVIANDNCSGKDLAAAATCTFTAQFKPMVGDEGPKQGQLKAIGASVANPAFLAVNGTALPPAGLVAVPKSLDFGPVPTNQESEPRTITVTNGGGVPTGPLVVDFAAPQFAKKADTCTGARLFASQGVEGTVPSCTIIVTFTPTQVHADATGIVTISDATNTAQVSLTGSGVTRPSLVLKPTVVCPQYEEDDPECYIAKENAAFATYNNVLVGQATAAKQFVLENWTDPTLAPDSGTLKFAITGAALDDFTIQTQNCNAPLTSTSSSAGVDHPACSFTVVFKPTAVGLRKALLQVTSSRGASAQATLEGKGLPMIELQPLEVSKKHTGLEFGQVPLGKNDAGDNSLAYRVWVRGTTQADRNSTVTITLPTPNPADFVWPTTAAENGLTILNGDKLLTPPLGHDGLPMVCSEDHAICNMDTFDRVAQTNPCSNKTLSFASGAVPAAGYGYVDVEGARYFFCDFGVQFYPQSARGALSAVLNTTSTGSGQTSLTLTGTATGPLVVTHGSNHDFAPMPYLLENPVAIGMSTTTFTLAIHNESATVDQHNLTFALSGTGAGDFQILGTDCWGDGPALAKKFHAYENIDAVTLLHGQNCEVWLGFQPTTEGPYSVTFTATAANGAGAEDDEVGTGTIIATGSKTFGPLTITAGGAFVDVPWSKNNATPVTFTVKNTGTLDATKFAFSVTPDYELLSTVGVSGACSVASSFVLAGGASCTLQVRPKPAVSTDSDKVPAGINKKQILGELSVTSTPAGSESPYTVIADLVYYMTSSIMVSDGGAPVSSLAYTFATANYLIPATKSFIVSNLGSSSVSLKCDDNPVPFQVMDSTTTPPACKCDGSTNNLGAGDTCTLVVQNRNNAARVISPEKPTELSIRDSATVGNEAVLLLSGTTRGPAKLETYGLNTTQGTPAPANGSRVNLGSVAVGDELKGAKATFQFRNTGSSTTKPLTFRWTVGGTTAANGAADSEFIVDSAEGSCLNKELEPNTFCTVSVHFKPAAGSGRTGERFGRFTLVDLSTNPENVADVYMRASVETTTIAEVREAPEGDMGFLQFAQPTGLYDEDDPPLTEEIRTIRITNRNATAQVVNLPETVGALDEFVIDPDPNSPPANPCGTENKSLATGEYCQFKVVFRPTTDTADLFRYASFAPIPADTTTVIGLMGRVKSPVKLEVWKPAVAGGDDGVADFGVATVGGTKTLTLTVVNIGEVPMPQAADEAGLVVGVADATNATFTFASGNLCEGVKLQAYGATGDRCLVTVTATGTAQGDATATFNVGKEESTGTPGASIDLAAEVLNAADLSIALAPDEPTGAFSATPVTGYTARTYRITNGSSTTYARSGVVSASLTGTRADQYMIVGNTCPPNVGLGSGDYCDVTVRFAPKMLSSDGNAFTATLNAQATPGGTEGISLQGTPKSALSISPAGTGTAQPRTYVMTEVTRRFEVSLDTANHADSTAPLKTSLTGSDFMLIDDQCDGAILSGTDASCTIDIKYIGRSTSTAKTATISVNGGSAGQSVAIIASFTGTEASSH